MSEREYRECLAAVIATLKRRAKRALRPAAVGVALLAGTGCGEDNSPPPPRDAIVSPDHPLYADAYTPADAGIDAFIPTDAHPYGVDTWPFQPPPDSAMADDSGSNDA
jgi:hypothetical protein